MKVVVTGAAGFIGSHLAERLASLGHDVVGIDSFNDYYDPALKESNAANVEAAGVPILRLNLADDPLEEALAGVEVIYHCAAQPGISATTTFQEYLTNNVLATRRLAAAAMEVDSLACFVNVSTSSVYGKHATDPETAAPRPASHYGVTKLAAEQLVLSYNRQNRLPACSIRLFSVYGPRERPEKLYPKLISSILHGRRCPLYEGSLEHTRSFTYIEDALAGFIAVLDNLDACDGEIFNIGSDREITTARGIEIVEGLLGAKARFETLPRRRGEQLRTHANIEKARRLLGYAPTTAPEEGLEREVAWYRDCVFGRTGPEGQSR